jgi:hypothetical protein
VAGDDRKGSLMSEECLECSGGEIFLRAKDGAARALSIVVAWWMAPHGERNGGGGAQLDLAHGTAEREGSLHDACGRWGARLATRPGRDGCGQRVARELGKRGSSTGTRGPVVLGPTQMNSANFDLIQIFKLNRIDSIK